MSKHTPEPCSVEGCERPAAFKVFLYDFYRWGEVFLERDHTCPSLCAHHASLNERKADGDRIPRGVTEYLYTNKHGAQGFTIYAEPGTITPPPRY